MAQTLNRDEISRSAARRDVDVVIEVVEGEDVRVVLAHRDAARPLALPFVVYAETIMSRGENVVIGARFLCTEVEAYRAMVETLYELEMIR